MDRIGLDWMGLDWGGLDWIGLGWVGLPATELSVNHPESFFRAFRTKRKSP